MNAKELTPQELRIGNYIEWSGNKHKVCKLDDSSGYLHVRKKNKESQYVPFHSVKPIPITSKWLIDFGFELNIENDAYYKESYAVSVSEDGCLFFYAGDYNLHELREFNYLHELQNLFHSLTGTELTIK